MTPVRRERLACGGQALVPALLLLSLCGVAWAALYNLGQVAAARARLTHAADAAVYSAALEQARTLNLLAYINRAQIAHQVAMAHLVTLATWARFADTEAQRHAMGNPPAYLIGSLFGAKAQMSYMAGRPTGDAAQEAARAYQAHDDLVHGTLLHVARQAISALPRPSIALAPAAESNAGSLFSRIAALSEPASICAASRPPCPGIALTSCAPTVLAASVR